MKFIFATGGTAGHINPALAVASYIKETYPESEILFIGTENHMEARLVPQAGFAFQTIDINGFKRSFAPKAVIENLKTVGKLLRSAQKSRAILQQFAPDVVIGFGGYVSGPVLQAAAKLHIPTCIHEQNAFPGITNKQLAKSVDTVMVTVEDAKQHLQAKGEIIVTGLPVRGEILKQDKGKARQLLGISDDKKLILSFGGSLGAAPLNDAIRPILLAHAQDKSVYHLHAAGTNGSAFLEDLEAHGFTQTAEGIYKKNTVEVRRYIDNMDVCMAAADVVISRAGASTLSEIEALGKASVLIPSPYVAENHQYHNAMALVNRHAACVLEEKNLSAETLEKEIQALLSAPETLMEIERNAKSMAMLDAHERIASIILSLAESRK